MKTIPLIFLILAFVLIGYLYRENLMNSNTNANEHNTETETFDGLMTTPLPLGKIRYEHSTLGFTIELNETFSYRFNESQKDEATFVFSRPNLETREDQRRDTPNGFNTSAEDRLTIRIFPNTEHLTAMSPLSDFSEWHNSAIQDQTITNSAQENIGRKNAIFTLEHDGINSTGQYFYLFSGASIFSIGSDDIPKSELDVIAQSFSFE